jgi:hypothetical protein
LVYSGHGLAGELVTEPIAQLGKAQHFVSDQRRGQRREDAKRRERRQLDRDGQQRNEGEYADEALLVERRSATPR